MTPFGKDPSPATPEARHLAGQTVIARDTKLVGELTGSKPVRIEGAIQGKVDVKAALEIGEGAQVEAEVRAASVRVAGTVTGNIYATSLVELLASARVTGDVTAAGLHVVEGAKLEGRVQMRVEGAKSPQAAPEKSR